jgi:hypothetical protein
MRPPSATVMRVRGAVVLCAVALPAALLAQTPMVPPAAGQNPSPMVEHTRAHTRLANEEPRGIRRRFNGPLDKPVQVFLPLGTRLDRPLHLVVHFHGAAFIPEVAVSRLGSPFISATVNIAPGSGAYDRTFSDPAVYDSLLAAVGRELAAASGKRASVNRVTLVGFSAGHGAIRAILRDPRHFESVNGVLLLDGLHTSYIPEGTVVEKGGVLDTTNLVAFTRYARAAVRGERRFLITHSEIFPGTFASTTETSDYLIDALGLKRKPVLQWGPGGMQQLSEVQRGQFEIMGFAGNAAPDHIDQFHGMPEFLRRLERR